MSCSEKFLFKISKPPKNAVSPPCCHIFKTDYFMECLILSFLAMI